MFTAIPDLAFETFLFSNGFNWHFKNSLIFVERIMAISYSHLNVFASLSETAAFMVASNTLINAHLKGI